MQKLSFFDRLLIKVALAKAAARGGDVSNAATALAAAFKRINCASGTPQSDPGAGR